MRMRTSRRAPGAGGRGPVRGRATALAVVVLALGGGLAGCGGQAEEVRDALAYADRVNRVQDSFGRDLDDLDGAAGRADERSDVRRAVQRLGDRIVRVQTELRAIRPPSRVAGAHRELITAFGAWTVPLDDFRRALRDRDPGATQRARVSFGRRTAAAERRVSTAAQTINSQLRSLSD